MKTVIIIDSGVSDKFNKEAFEINGLSFCISDGEIKMTDDFSDKIGHGTAVMDILTSYTYSDNIRFIMIKIFDEKEETDEDLLIYALKYIYENIPCDLIHISNGVVSCCNLSDIENICNLLARCGIIIVSAFDNLGGISYPAALDSVIGVDYNFGSGGTFSFDYIEDSVVNISARHTEQRLMWKDCRRKILQGNSFIAPHISALILEYLCTHGKSSLTEVKGFLSGKAKAVHHGEGVSPAADIHPFDIKKACIFPFNKEIHTLARCDDMCSFEILHYFDSRYLGSCGKALSSVLKGTDSDKKIENIDNIDWNEDFDTFILGHTDAIENMSGKKYAEKIIENCIRYKKSLFAFDGLNITPDIVKRFTENGLGIYYPSVHNKGYSYNSGKLYSFSTPVLAVLGTSSRQGKFTLQLGIKKCLSEEGYDIGHLGTEPASILLGADDDYVTGYNSDGDSDSCTNILRINQIMHDIEKKEHDLIIVGSQSHTVPMGYSNIGMLPVYQQDILFAALPDACVLCVNYYDDTEYISRTIRYIEGICEAKVIALCISVFGAASGWTSLGVCREDADMQQICDGRKRISESFDIPVYMYNETDGISREIIKYFSESN